MAVVSEFAWPKAEEVTETMAIFLHQNGMETMTRPHVPSGWARVRVEIPNPITPALWKGVIKKWLISRNTGVVVELGLDDELYLICPEDQGERLKRLFLKDIFKQEAPPPPPPAPAAARASAEDKSPCEAIVKHITQVFKRPRISAAARKQTAEAMQWLQEHPPRARDGRAAPRPPTRDGRTAPISPTRAMQWLKEPPSPPRDGQEAPRPPPPTTNDVPRPMRAPRLVLGVDTETTGLMHASTEIVSLGWCLFADGVRVRLAEHVMQFSGKNTPGALRIHQITKAVAQQWGADPRASLAEFLKLAQTVNSEGGVVVAHNAKFDKFMLENTARLNGMSDYTLPPIFCTYMAARGVLELRENGKLNLATLHAFFGGQTGTKRHSAAEDAQSAAEIFMGGVARGFWGISKK